MTPLIHACDAMVGFVRLVSRWAARAIGLALLAVVFFITVEVVLRKLAGHSLQGVEEYSGYMLAILSSWGLAHTLIEKAHIRIDVAYGKLPPTAQAALDVVAILALNLVSWLIALNAYPVLLKSLANDSLANTPLATPLWLPQAVWAAGYVWFALTTTVLGLRMLLAAVTADRATLQRLGGAGDSEAPL